MVGTWERLGLTQLDEAVPSNARAPNAIRTMERTNDLIAGSTSDIVKEAPVSTGIHPDDDGADGIQIIGLNQGLLIAQHGLIDSHAHAGVGAQGLQGLVYLEGCADSDFEVNEATSRGEVLNNSPVYVVSTRNGLEAIHKSPRALIS